MACLLSSIPGSVPAAPSPELLTVQPEPGTQFRLGQNYPNPFYAETTIFFSLAAPSDVLLALYDLRGHMVKELSQTGLGAGPQEFILNLPALGLPRASYVYQLHVHNAAGHFTDYRLMTAAAP
ncbi:T9SS type A sorting domain-containing protein [Hymenobacter gummosus]|uniref:T9SS type A sorting domain-containing protein n=1 Tax=Hymenobacter gummosus TaxID=1776032 RepID=A0A431U636_9BACT|nr:T9SS type A sorting domain-containing protein [Hymenobacter gummosus]RTQ52105.1 T9SS type A sorting domain-containing protein [Hymenobacter gummosus]